MNIEKRKQPRHEREDFIHIEVLAASHHTVKDNFVLECTTKDISVDGLKVHTKSPLNVEAILELIIAFGDGGYKFLLTAQVKWIDKIGDDDFHAGFKIVEAEHSDFVEWREMFSEIDLRKIS